MGTTKRVSPANLHIFPGGHDGTQKPGRGSSQNPSQRLIPLGAGETQNSDRISNKNHVTHFNSKPSRTTILATRSQIHCARRDECLLGGREGSDSHKGASSHVGETCGSWISRGTSGTWTGGVCLVLMCLFDRKEGCAS